ncbi:class I SAM-dependent methyltransferase [Stenotrophomonas sp. LARHCG68]
MQSSKAPAATRYSERTGIVAPADGWSPPIRYLLRRARILQLIRDIPPGSLLEIGCGSGALLCDLSRQGHSAQGLETSFQARHMAIRLAELCKTTYSISPEPLREWAGHFNTICAFDVLEHIEDDARALQEWSRWLAPSGKLILSVPAHRSRFGAGDVWAGHWRRYDRKDLKELLSSNGYAIEHFECYGFPLANMTELVGNLVYSKKLKQRDTQSKAQASAASGVDRSDYVQLSDWITSLPGQFMIATGSAMQTISRNLDWGSGYLVMARRA